MQGLILDGEFIDVFIVRGMIVNCPTGRAEHEIAGRPFVAFPSDSAVTTSSKIVIDRRRGMPMWLVHNIRGADGNRREESVCGSIGASGRWIEKQIQTPADVFLSKRPETIQLALHLCPRPEQRLHLDVVRIDELLIRHEPSSFRSQLKSPKWADFRWVARSPRFVFLFVVRLWCFFNHVNRELLKEWRIAVAEPHLEFAGVILDFVSRPARRSPQVVPRELELRALH